MFIEQNWEFPYELLELIFLKTDYIWTLSLWKTMPNPDSDIFMNLAAVSSLWHQAMTARPWFEHSLRRRLSSKLVSQIAAADTIICIVFNGDHSGKNLD